MIAPEVNVILLVSLTGLILFNLLLTLRLSRSLKQVQMNLMKTAPLNVGEQVPTLVARRMLDDSVWDHSTIANEAKVYLFLSPQCPKCSAKLPEIEAMMNRSQDMGVSIWLLTDEPQEPMRAFLAGTMLSSRVLTIQENMLTTLNPGQASPYYLFVNQDDSLQAEGLIGDDNWLSFKAQILDGN